PELGRSSTDQPGGSRSRTASVAARALAVPYFTPFRIMWNMLFCGTYGKLDLSYPVAPLFPWRGIGSLPDVHCGVRCRRTCPRNHSRIAELRGSFSHSSFPGGCRDRTR